MKRVVVQQYKNSTQHMWRVLLCCSNNYRGNSLLPYVAARSFHGGVVAKPFSALVSYGGNNNSGAVNKIFKRNIVGDIRISDLHDGDYYSPEQQMAVLKKKRLMAVLETSKDYAVQQKAYEDLLQLQSSFRDLVCEPGFDIFGRPAAAQQHDESNENVDEIKVDEGRGDWEAIKYMEDYKSVVDQIIYRETFKIGRHIKITAGGRVESASAFVVIGTGKGAAAYGYGKAPTVDVALRKANADAEKNLVNVDFYNGRIPHDIDARFGGTLLRFYATRPGNGIVACELVRDLCVAFGLTDVSVKIHGNRNIVAIIKAFFRGMLSFVNPITSAKLRGEKVFDPRKIWRKGDPVFSYGQLSHLLNRDADLEEDIGEDDFDTTIDDLDEFEKRYDEFEKELEEDDEELDETEYSEMMNDIEQGNGKSRRFKSK